MTLDLTGERFGLLKVVCQAAKKAQPNGQKPTRWKCLCECGHYTIVTTGNLTSGHTISCGCKRYSKNELVIENLLTDWKIPHSKEYSFDDLVTDKGNPLRFDFAFLDRQSNLVALLEYQGVQHFVENPLCIEFGRQQREMTDQMKKDYCVEHDISLYEITYQDDIENKLRSITHTLYGNLVPSPEQSGKV